MTKPDAITEEQLRACLERGETQRVLALLEPHPSAELKHLQKVLKAKRAELREVQSRSWREADRMARPLVVAGVLCSDTPAQAASWLGSRNLFYWFHIATAPMFRESLLTNRHDYAWVRDLTLRLAEKQRADGDTDYWRFVENLAVRSGALPPITPAHISGWMLASRMERWDAGQRGHPVTLKDWLRRQPRLRERVAGIFTADGAGGDLLTPPGSVDSPESQWPKVLADLASEGLLDRGELIDDCTARLLRGDRPGSLRGYLDVFEALKPTREEVRERRGTYQSMATSAAGPVSKLAQQELRALDADEPGEPMDLAELSAAMLSRAESGLANTQLAWLDATLKRDPGTAAVLLPCIGSAFAHPVTSVQQRALKVLARHLKAADQRTVAELRDAALSIDPALRADADQLFAAYVDEPAADAVVPTDFLPEYQPTALPPMPGTPEELATALAPSYARGEIGPLEAEQLMAAVAVLAHRDRAGLAEVFRPLYDRYVPGGKKSKLHAWELWNFPSALQCLLEAVLGVDRRDGRVRVATMAEKIPKAAILLRVQELTDALLKHKTVPLLLATPTESSGAIDPAVLADRKAAYRELGIKPLPLDLEQAELRVAADPVRQKTFAGLVLGEASAINEELGKSDVLRFTVLSSSRGPMLGLGSSKVSLASFLLPETTREGKLRLPQPPGYWRGSAQNAFWPIVLPHDPDVIAVHTLTRLYDAANDMGEGGREPNVFPGLAETAGTPGPFTHLALAYALAADSLEQRIAAQDAVLILASRGLLRPDQLGRLAAIVWQRGLVRGKRIVEALAQIEQSGAAAEVFGVTAAMIGELAKTPELRTLPEVLLLATRCAVGAGIRGIEVPGLPDLAAVTKPKRVGTEARRLREAIAAAG